MSDNQKHEQRHFAIMVLKILVFTIQNLWLTVNTNFLSFIVCN